jgi:hypothetical protein
MLLQSFAAIADSGMAETTRIRGARRAYRDVGRWLALHTVSEATLRRVDGREAHGDSIAKQVAKVARTKWLGWMCLITLPDAVVIRNEMPL